MFFIKMIWSMKLIVASILLCLSFAIIDSAPHDALITSLPGFNGRFPSKHYAGYVTIDKERSKNLWYYFVESERKASRDPVVLWLNGGPGCSSMDGFVYEHGPFNFEKTNTNTTLLHLNPYSWSKVSNIIYLDSPVGVGFSYSKNRSDYVTSDLKTASDAHAFLLEWFNMFPEFQENPFFISGESYAGIYVPTLASQVVQGNKAGNTPFINLKGYLVGNAVTDQVFDGNALVPFAHGMGLISNELFEEVTSACNGNYYDTQQIGDCSEKLGEVEDNVDLLNLYNILEPCNRGKSLSKIDLGKRDRLSDVRKKMNGWKWPLGGAVRLGLVPNLANILDRSGVPCSDNSVATTWLNDPEVRKTVHAKEESEIGRWVLYAREIVFSHDAGSMLQYHRNLTLGGYRALIYSGDHDMCVPYTGSEAWTKSLGYKVVDEWRPWISNDQVAGYTQSYAYNLTFLTVKGAGHTVPQYKPREALDFYSRFLLDQKI